MAASRTPQTNDALLAEDARSLALDDLVDASAVAEVPEVRQTYGVVTAEGDATLSVRVGTHSIAVKRAASCLLEPKVGDQVLVAVTDRDQSFVLAVLAQAARETKGGVLSLDGDITLRANHGKIAVVAREAISLTSGSEVAISTPELTVQSLKTTFFSESLSYIGRKIETEVEKIKLVAQTLDSTIDRVSARLKRSYRTVEEIEHLKTKELDVVVEGNANLHSDNTIISADKLVKVDGEQIHLG